MNVRLTWYVQTITRVVSKMAFLKSLNQHHDKSPTNCNESVKSMRRSKKLRPDGELKMENSGKPGKRSSVTDRIRMIRCASWPE